MKKKCSVCKKELTGIKTKFCGDVCYFKNKSESGKRIVLLNRRNNLPKKCSVCSSKFFPKREDHKTCSKLCSKVRAKQQQQIKRECLRSYKRVRPMAFPMAFPFSKSRKRSPKIKMKSSASFNPADKTKDEVIAYLKAGGKIKKFPDEPQAKIPSVGLPFEYKSSNELYGWGLEFEQEEQESLEQVYANNH